MIGALKAAVWNLTHPGRLPHCPHGFAPDQGLGLWCPQCDKPVRGYDYTPPHPRRSS